MPLGKQNALFSPVADMNEMMIYQSAFDGQ